MPKLQILELSNNQIQDFDKTIEHLSEIETLTELVLRDNPASKGRFSYKYDILWALKLVKLDQEVVT